MNDYIWKKTKEKTDDYPDYNGCVNMIVRERIVTFINSMETENSQILEEHRERSFGFPRADDSERNAELFKGALTCTEPLSAFWKSELP